MAKSMAVVVSISGNTVTFYADVTCSGESYRGSHRAGSYSVSGPGGAITSGTFTSPANKNATTRIHTGTCGTNGCGTYTASYVYDPNSWKLTASGSSAVGHSNTAAGALRTAATCTAAATYWYKCSRCGTQSSSYFSSGNALGHSNTAQGALRTNATCTAAATYWYKCSRCGTQASTYFNSGTALGHATPSAYAYAANNNISNGMRYKNCTRCSTRLVTQYGIWADVGTGISATSGTNWYNANSTASIGATAKTGYTWGKWSDEVTTNPRSIIVNKAYKLTASANPHTYTIVYDGNGAKNGSTASSSHTYDAEKALTENGYTKPGYKFIGWSTSANGSVVYTDKQNVLNLTSTNGATITLYAIWELSANAQFGIDGKWKPVMLYIGKNSKWNNIILNCGKNNEWKATGL